MTADARRNCAASQSYYAKLDFRSRHHNVQLSPPREPSRAADRVSLRAKLLDNVRLRSLASSARRARAPRMVLVCAEHAACRSAGKHGISLVARVGEWYRGPHSPSNQSYSRGPRSTGAPRRHRTRAARTERTVMTTAQQPDVAPENSATTPYTPATPNPAPHAPQERRGT